MEEESRLQKTKEIKCDKGAKKSNILTVEEGYKLKKDKHKRKFKSSNDPNKRKKKVLAGFMEFQAITIMNVDPYTRSQSLQQILRRTL